MTGPADRRWRQVLLRLLPRTFRNRFGSDMDEVARALASEARAAGRLQQARYIAREFLDTLRLSASLRRRHTADRTKRRSLPSGPATLYELGWSLRHARRRPVLSTAIIATVALSVATATTAFGVAAAVLWRPLPFDDPQRLLFVWEEVERDGQPFAARVTGARYVAWREAAGETASLSVFGAAGFSFDTPGGAITLRGLRVSADYFDTLGIRPTIGRTFSIDDGMPGGDQVVVLSTAFWREHLGSRHDVIGAVVRFSGRPMTVIGVMPDAPYPGWPVNPADVILDREAHQFWVPIARTPALASNARAHVFGVLGRVRHGTPSDLLARLNRTAGPSAAEPHAARLAAFREQFVADARVPLLTLTAAATAVLLLACANLAALYSSLFEARRTELSTRRALGATVGRLAGQIACESLLLVGTGTMIGVGLAHAALTQVTAVVPTSIPLLSSPAVDGRAVAFAVMLGLTTTGLVSAWPMLGILRSTPAPRGVTPVGRTPVLRLLVVPQVGVAVALSFVAVLLGRSLHAVERQPLGFGAEHVLVADLSFPPSPAQGAAEELVLAAIAALPGVVGVTAAYDHPLEANWSENPTVLGDDADTSMQRPADLRIVSPGYFEVMDVQVIEGRPLSERDGLGAPGVAVVNEAFARQLAGRVIGRRLQTGTPAAMVAGAPREFEIVGVVVNERFRGLERAAPPAFYLSTRQFPQTALSLLVRTGSDPIGRGGDIRSTVRLVDPRITFDRVTTLERILDEGLSSRRLTTNVIGGFAAIALSLSALGLYGLLSMAVACRTRDIGVRLAIGASPAAVARQVVGHALRDAGLGILLGVGAAIAAGRLLENLLVGASHRDPVLLAGVAIVLLATATLAAAIPAFRAAHIDPVTALRRE